MKTLICILCLCIYGVTGDCSSCNTSHIRAWTFSVNNGEGTARCCSQSGASAGTYLQWRNGSYVTFTPSSDSHSEDGCEELSVTLTEQHCDMQIVCRTFGEFKSNASIGVTELTSSCSSLFSGSNSVNILQVCLNCNARSSESTSSSEFTSTSSLTTITTASVSSGAVFSPAVTFMVAMQKNNGNFVPGIVVGGIIIIIIIALAIIITVVVLHKKRKNNTFEPPKQAEEGTNLLDTYTNDTRSGPNSSDSSLLKEPAVNSEVPIHPFANGEPPGKESQNLDSSNIKPVEDAQTSPAEQKESGVSCSEPSGKMVTAVLLASSKLIYPQSKDTNDVEKLRYVTEKDTEKMFCRSLSCPSGDFNT